MKRINLTLATLITTITLYSFVNGSGCNYKVNIIDSVNPNHKIKMTCYRGDFVALHTLKYGDNIAKWKVTGKQFNLSNQLIYFIETRTPLIEPNYKNKLDDTIQMSKEHRLLFYAYKLDGDNLTIYEDFPEVKTLTTNFTGQMSQWNN
ncbi:hypothetical protein [Aliivibrio sp. EL58]|jgi:hypothetical protein|uniref:hypothetical protein n=1 Tax=Aliivibrio sp. EL58 TaxID=2107582 RepID=UPI000EFA3B5B|nr:hypothetical protein [Aliivibrio sp. EL58]